MTVRCTVESEVVRLEVPRGGAVVRLCYPTRAVVRDFWVILAILGAPVPREIVVDDTAAPHSLSARALRAAGAILALPLDACAENG